MPRQYYQDPKVEIRAAAERSFYFIHYRDSGSGARCGLPSCAKGCGQRPSRSNGR